VHVRARVPLSRFAQRSSGAAGRRRLYLPVESESPIIAGRGVTP
jgi:hypothetical protein